MDIDMVMDMDLNNICSDIELYAECLLPGLADINVGSVPTYAKI